MSIKQRPVSMVPLKDFEDHDFELVFSKFTLGPVLGKGAFSTVHKGTYDGMDVAVKQQKLVDEELERYIRKELSILRRCNHPGLVKYIGACKVNKATVLIATEYCPGGDLRRLLQSKDELGWKLRCKIALGVAEGIAYLHQRDYIHRDIKTENILLDKDFNTKLCDFGFARGTERGTGRPMTMCGTDEFMAPEVIFGMEYDEKADIFGFGIVLAELISRRVPGKKGGGFLERKPMNGFTVDKEELQQVLSEYSPPQSLLLLCEECLSDEAIDRPSAEECFNWLDDLLNELPEDTTKRPTLSEAKILSSAKQMLEEEEAQEKEEEEEAEIQGRDSVYDEEAPAKVTEDRKERIRRATFVARQQYEARGHKPKLLVEDFDDESESFVESTASEDPSHGLSSDDSSTAYSATLSSLQHSLQPPRPSNEVPQMSGYVVKRGGRIKTWRKRFMVITTEGLVYFKREEDFRKKPPSIQGSLLFEEICKPKKATTVCEAVPMLQTGKQYSFRVMTAARPRYFHTKNKRLTDMWVRQINIAYTTWAANRQTTTAAARKGSSVSPLT